jgi:hypothetical protein
MRYNCKVCGSSAFQSLEHFVKFEGKCKRCSGINRLYRVELQNYPQHILGDYYRTHVVIAFDRGHLKKILASQAPVGFESRKGFKIEDWRISEIRSIKKISGIEKSDLSKVDTLKALENYAKHYVQPYIKDSQGWHVGLSGSSIEVFDKVEKALFDGRKKKSMSTETVFSL